MNYTIYEDANLVKKEGYRPQIVRRSWKERLWSWPWRPWVSSKTIQVVNFVPDMDYYILGSNIVCHPAAAEVLRKSGAIAGRSIVV